MDRIQSVNSAGSSPSGAPATGVPTGKAESRATGGSSAGHDSQASGVDQMDHTPDSPDQGTIPNFGNSLPPGTRRRCFTPPPKPEDTKPKRCGEA